MNSVAAAFAGRISEPLILFPEFPVEQTIRSLVHGSQEAFSRDVTTQLRKSRFRDAHLSPGDEGVLVLGAEERALIPPVRAVLELCNGGIAISEPRLRGRADAPASASVMLVDVQVPRVHARDLLRELRTRRARMLSAKFGMFRLRVQAELPREAALGFPNWVVEATEGKAHVELRRAAPLSDKRNATQARAGVASGSRSSTRRKQLQLNWSPAPVPAANWAFASGSKRIR